MKYVVFILSLLLISFPVLAAEKESAYDRVMRTGTIRCGYMVLPPHILKDPNTGKMSGIIYDTMEEAGKLLNLKIDWSEEVTFPTMITALQTQRVDALCFGFWRNPADGKYVTCLVPRSSGLCYRDLMEADLWVIFTTLTPGQRHESDKKYKTLKRVSLR